MNQAVGAGRADGLIVEPFGIEFASFDPRDLRAQKTRSPSDSGADLAVQFG
jgi:hypothetical protein